MLKFLRNPYPRTTSWVRLLYTALGFGLFVFLFLFLFKPFGLSQVKPLPYVTAYFGLITTACMLFTFALRHFFSAEPEHWTAGKEILFTLFTILFIASVNWLKTADWGFTTLSLEAWGTFLLYTFSIGVFPVVFAVFISEKRQRQEYTQASLNLHPIAANKDQSVSLVGEGQSENLTVPTSHLLYIKASDNYCEIYIHESGKDHCIVFRVSLKQIEEQLTAYPEFLRVHRSYIVNTQGVERISGNAQGFRLHIHKHEIPVSRGMNSEIKSRFS